MPSRSLGEGPPTGTTVRYFGDYELLVEIARGGMGVVYQARQVSLNRIVALKMILAGQLASEEDVKRFHAEAEAAANLDHPGIVPIYEVGQHEGQHYFSMGFVEGSSLSAKVAGGPLPPSKAAEYTQKIAAAVAFAHMHGVIHRDLKPANVLLDRNDEPRVTDFGLAKKVEGDSGLTASGQILGTPGYMPPEQASGKIHEVTETADIYSLGAILYCLLTARPPLQADNPLDTLMQVLEREPVSPRTLNSKVPRDLETICLKCLEKQRSRRYQTATELAADLERFLREEPIRARPAGVAYRGWKWAKRYPAIAGLSATVSLLLIAGIVGTTWAYFREAGLRAAADRARHVAAERAVSEAGARQEAEAERRKAEAERDNALRNAYLASMNLASRGWSESNPLQTRDQLDRWLPHKTFGKDLRQWEWHFLNGCGLRQSRILRDGLPGEFFSEAVCSSGLERFAWADGERNSVGVYDVTAARQLWASQSFSRPYALRFDPAAQRLAIGRADGVVSVVQASSGHELVALKGHAGSVLAVSFSPDGRWLASGGQDPWDGIWDCETGDLAKKLPWQNTNCAALAFSSDGKRVAQTGGLGQVVVWDIEFEQVTWSAFVNDDPQRTIAFSPDGKSLATAGNEGTIRFWDLVRPQPVQMLTSRSRTIEHIALSADGRKLVSCGWDRRLLIWDVQTQQSLGICKGHRTRVLAAEIAPEGHRLISVGDDGRVVSWSGLMHGDSLAVRGTSIISAIAWWRDRNQLISAGESESMRLWNVITGQQAGQLGGLDARVTDIALSPDGRTLASGDDGGTILFWDLESGVKKQDWRIGVGVKCLSYAPKGEALALATDDGRVLVRGISGNAAGVEVKTGGPVNKLRYFPSGDKLACASGNTVKIWDVTTARDIGQFAHRTVVRDLDLDPHGRYLATVDTDDGLVILWDVRNGQKQRVMSGHNNPTCCVCFSPNGNRIASADSAGKIKFWDVATGFEVLEIQARSPTPAEILLSHDGKWLCGGFPNGDVEIWDARPASEEIQREREAVDLLKAKRFDYVFGDVTTRREVDEWLRKDTLIDANVRELAMSLADAFDWVDLEREQLEVWLFQVPGKRGAYVKSKDRWLEIQSNGETYVFAEVGRNDEFVELLDSSRGLGYGIRLYRDHCEIRYGQEAWRRFYPGDWLTRERSKE